MNKLISILFALLFITPIAFAEDCMHDPIYERDWNAEITTGMRVRDIQCMESSVVLTTVPVGTVVKVIAETDGYYKVRLADGTEGWSGQWLLAPTSKPFNPSIPEAPKEPLYDVAGHDYETAVRYLKDNGVIEGYSDGSYQPSKNVNRAEFTKIIVEAKLGSNPTSSADNCFPDVSSSEWYSSYVCYAKNEGIIGGYPDGYFRPSNTINLAEATKILVNTLNVEKPDTESTIWYRVFIEAMQNKRYLPQSFKAIDQAVNRGEMAEMVWRIQEKLQSQPFVQFQFEEEPASNPEEAGDLLSCADANLPSTIDMDKVRETWLGWYNGSRTASGLHAYTYNDYLNYSATVWSEHSRDIGIMSHNRPGQTDYYDYSLITDWFANLGLAFKNISGVTYSENIGYGTYRCSDSDCTQELIDSIKHIYDGYMAEKGTSYTGHYDSVMNAIFKEIGVGIAVDTSKEVMYITVHYGTELSSHPVDVCGN